MNITRLSINTFHLYHESSSIQSQTYQLPAKHSYCQTCYEKSIKQGQQLWGEESREASEESIIIIHNIMMAMHNTLQGKRLCCVT